MDSRKTFPVDGPEGEQRDGEPVMKNRKFSLYNGFWQIVLVGVIAFCCPGMFNAIVGVGGGGTADARLASFPLFFLYASFAIFGYAGGLFFNYFGPRLLMTFAGFTYALYIVFNYLVAQPDAADWAFPLWVFSGFLLGVGAAVFWTSQGALMMAYAPEAMKGTYIAIFWVIFNLGGVIGGLMIFAVNYSSDEATASAATYFALVGVMVFGALMALFLVRPTSVVREDGLQVTLPPLKSFREELSDVARVVTDSNMSFLFPLFFSSNFFYTYVFNGVNSKSVAIDGVNTSFFTIRTRGLNAAVFWGAQMFGSVIFAYLVDTNQALRTRGNKGYFFVLVSMTVSWALGIYLEFGYDKPLPIDFASAAWVYPFFVMAGYGLGDSVLQTFAYWLMSVLAKDDTVLAARYAGYYKGVQSLGAMVAWLIDSVYVGASAELQLWICVSLFVVSMALAYPVVRRLSAREPLLNEYSV